MDQNELKMKVRQTFDTVCEGYDCPSLRFFNKAAAHLPQVFGFRGNEQPQKPGQRESKRGRRDYFLTSPVE